MDKIEEALSYKKSLHLYITGIKDNIFMSHTETETTWNTCSSQPMSRCVPPSRAPLCVPHTLA